MRVWTIWITGKYRPVIILKILSVIVRGIVCKRVAVMRWLVWLLIIGIMMSFWADSILLFVILVVAK